MTRLGRRRARAAVVVVIAAACVAACDSGSGATAIGPGGTTTGSVATVTIEGLAASLVVADSQRLTATAKDSRGAVVTGRPATWSSSSSAIATVSTDGTVLGIGPGTATITATIDGQSGTTPVTVVLDPARSLAVAPAYSCAITATGAAYCWGANNVGQLGANDNIQLSPPVRVAGNLAFVEIAVNTAGGCGITTQRAAYCWGSIYLGNGSTASSLAPVAVSGELQFRSITVGERFVCGLTVARTAYCWGENSDSRIGIVPPSVVVTAPAPVTTTQTFVQITAGSAHICALTAAGAAYCWGNNLAAQVGSGGASQLQTTPLPVVGGLTFRRLAASTETTCGVTTAGAVYCWGTNQYGSLGTGLINQATVATPTAVPGATSVASITAGNSADQRSPVCVWTQSGTASCWGANQAGQLGTGTSGSTCAFSTPCAPVPTPVAGQSDFTAIAAAADHSCGMTRRHTVYCWGANSTGALGDGTLTNRTTPVAVTGLPATP